jgi:hypothetical protein
LDIETLKAQIRLWAPKLDLQGTGIDDADPELILAALAYCETKFWDSKWQKPRVEPAYLPGGRYYAASLGLRKAYAQYGPDAAASWGPWQLMFPTAVELGYTGNPSDLVEQSAEFVVAYLNRRVLYLTGLNLEDIPDGYNSGSCLDRIIPRAYIKEFIEAYETQAPAWLHHDRAAAGRRG